MRLVHVVSRGSWLQRKRWPPTFSRSANSRATAVQSDDPGYEGQTGELSMPGSVESIVLSIVVLSLVFACAALIRRFSRPLRKLFVPTAVIGGFSRPRARPGGDGPAPRWERGLSR